MSISEVGVVIGVALEGTEYVPWIHKRWPILERIGFLLLLVSLVADWHFQSAINERQTQALVAADNRIASLTSQVIELSPRLRLTNNEAFLTTLAKAASKYSGQKLKLFINLNTADDREEVLGFARQINIVFAGAGWRDPSGNKITFANSIGSNVEYDPPDREGARGVALHTWADAPLRTSKAADEIVEVLRSVGVMAYHSTATTKFSTSGASSHDVLEMTVARRLEL